MLLVVNPVLLLAGLAAVEEHGVRGAGILVSLGCANVFFVRAGIRPRVVLCPDGTVRDVTPLTVAHVRISKKEDVVSSRNGLSLTASGGEVFFWAFSPSAIGGRSTRNALAQVRQWVVSAPASATGVSTVEGRRGVYGTWSDAVITAIPLVLGLIVAL
ncbi:hypothetical protein [Streptomyces sp. NPDC094049]|uniref:hypothetical protein n=1 Tax=Streptomyces sp. NPDC094049 TaxID=3154987 RepID=UPI00331CDD52